MERFARHSPSRFAALTLLTWLVSASRALAQCDEWDPRFGVPDGGTLGDVDCLVTLDDGSGPLLYAGGGFTAIDDTSADSVARWDGSSWSALRGGARPIGVHAFALYDDGTGEALYAGGYDFRYPGSTAQYGVGRWDGSAWSPVGTLASGGHFSPVNDLVAFDDGSGTKLYAALIELGDFGQGVLAWDGVTWSIVGAPFDWGANQLCVFDDGTGAKLYALGGFNHIGSTATFGLASWDGTSWASVGQSLSTSLTAICVYDEGAGPRLFAAASNGQVLRLTGSTWTSVGGMSNATRIYRMSVHDDGSGPKLCVFGSFNQTLASGVVAHCAMAWDGAVWSAFGNGPAIGSILVSEVRTAASFGSGPERRLFVGGEFPALPDGTPARNLARWDGNTWSPASSSVAPGGLRFEHVPTNYYALGSVHAIAPFDRGGVATYVAGNFTRAGTLVANNIVRWDGQAWSAPGSGVFGSIWALAEFDASPGTPLSDRRLFAGGSFTTMDGAPAANLASYDGVSWSAVGTGVSGADPQIHALLAADLPGIATHGLFIAGTFTTPGPRLALYDSTNANPRSFGGLTNSTYDIRALAVFDDGTGPHLYIGGLMNVAGATPVRNIARCDAPNFWSTLGAGTNNLVAALCTFDDGSGEQLYAGGYFTTAGGNSAPYVARWNGVAWSAVGFGMNAPVEVLAVHDDGSGPALYAGGQFTFADGLPAQGLARWRNGAWSSVNGGVNVSGDVGVRALLSEGNGPKSLWVGGKFGGAGERASTSIARFGCGTRLESFCSSDGALGDHTTTCPCGNVGAPGHGCGHSFDAGGALLAATGFPVTDDVVLASSSMPVSSFTLFLQHSAAGDATFHDGVLCAGGTLVRLRGRGAVAGRASFPNASFANDSTTTLSQRGGVFPGQGLRRYYSAWYRNASTTFCPPATANVTNGIRVDW